jgi:hypothetical protein
LIIYLFCSASFKNINVDKKGRCYVLYVDLSKAFDSIPHSHLWYCLLSKGIHGNVIQVIRSMYANLKCCIKLPSGITEYFNCTVGTRQGCMLSPLLFSLYIGEFVDMLNDNNCEGIYVSENAPSIISLLYADDLANCGDSVGRLQAVINVLEFFCCKWGLKINMSKTKVIVFRRGGIIKANEKWYFNGNEIEVVPHYKYLGIVFSSMLCWSKAVNTLCSQANKAIYMLYNLNAKVGGLSIDTAFFSV